MSDVSKTKDLIAYARKWIKLHRENEYQREAAKIMTSVVDALESATRVPVQGEPNDDYELVDVVLTTADIEKLAHLLVQLSPVTHRNSHATIRKLLKEMNIKEVDQ